MNMMLVIQTAIIKFSVRKFSDLYDRFGTGTD